MTMVHVRWSTHSPAGGCDSGYKFDSLHLETNVVSVSLPRAERDGRLTASRKRASVRIKSDDHWVTYCNTVRRRHQDSEAESLVDKHHDDQDCVLNIRDELTVPMRPSIY